MQVASRTEAVGASRRRRRRRGGFFAWRHTIGWRLALSYAALLALLLLTLGIALNAVFSKVLYDEELARFQTETQALVAVYQHDFELGVQGSGSACAGAESFQESFAQNVANPYTQARPGVMGVYLLNSLGTTLAPQTASFVGQRPPYFEEGQLLKLRQAQQYALSQQGTGALAAVAYFARGTGAQTGVALVVVRYHTTSPCVTKRNGAVGIIEVVSAFPRTRAVLASIRLILLVAMLVVLVAGLLIGLPLTSYMLRPLKRMTQTAHRIAEGDLSQRVALPHSDDEIGQLAGVFDEMVGRIEAAFATQQGSEERMRQFIADASHELRTPLTSMRGFTDVLLRGAKDDPETAQEVLLALRRETERMTRLVTDLLTLARLDMNRPMEFQPVDVIALAGEAVDQARILAGEREVALRTDGAGRLMASVDPDRMKQVLLILLDNALKYGRQTPDGWVRMGVGRNGSEAVITISDNGPGIAAQDLAHIFDRFYRVKQARSRSTPSTPDPGGFSSGSAARSQQPEGSGLGLPIARAIAQAHGGSLTVQSRLGEGTTFTLLLPLSSKG